MAPAGSGDGVDDSDRSHCLSLALFALSQLGFLDLHFTLVAGLIFGVSVLILMVESLIRQRPFEPEPQTVWTPATVSDFPSGSVSYFASTSFSASDQSVKGSPPTNARFWARRQAFSRIFSQRSAEEIIGLPFPEEPRVVLGGVGLRAPVSPLEALLLVVIASFSKQIVLDRMSQDRSGTAGNPRKKGGDTVGCPPLEPSQYLDSRGEIIIPSG
jgi:hypothetical protein